MLDIITLIPNSFYASFLISIAVAIIGSLIVINKSSFIAGSIAHGSFGGIGLAIYFSLPILLMTSLFATFLALILSYITLKIPHRSDTIIGVVWAVGMSIGILFSELTPGYNAGLISYLFGSILTISNEDIYMMMSVDIALIIFISILYNQVLLISYDKDFANVRGLNVGFLHTLLLVLISLTVVMSVRAIGLILIIAMFTVPPFIAEKFTKTLKSMMVLAGILSAVFMISGIFISFYYDVSATATIILVATAFFFISLFKR